VFHHPAWLAVLRDQYAYRFRLCCCLRDGEVVAGLPVAEIDSRLTGRRLVALPFSDACEPVVSLLAREARPVLLAGLDALRTGLGVQLEIRGPVPDLPSAHVVPSYLRHDLRLEDDVAAVERRYARSQVRRGIARARREGLVAERHVSPWSLDEFYRLHARTRRRQGMPVQAKRFVARLASLYAAGLGFTLLVRRDGRTLAAAVFLTFGEVLTYKYGASDERFLALRPNNLLFGEAIRWGCEHGMRRLDLGRTDVGNEGLRAFKRAWGAEERALAYTFTSPPAPRGGGRGQRALATLIRRGPPGLGRVIGSALYPHVG